MARPRERCSLAVLFAFALVTGSCAVIDALSDDQGIKYPESGIHGLNLLDPNLTVGTLNAIMSFRAELGGKASLRILVFNSSTVALSVSDPGGSGWVVDLGSPLGGTNTFVALEGLKSPDLRVSPIDGGETVEGELRIEYFENGALAPTLSRVITFVPGPPGGCRARGQPCSPATECCAPAFCELGPGDQGVCVDGDACRGAGEPCSFDGDCCSSNCGPDPVEPAMLVCDPGPGTCRFDGEPCVSGTECCSNNCSEQICESSPPCGGEGAICATSGDCCSDLCTVDPGGNSVCCVGPGGLSNGDTCTAPEDCCSNHCTQDPGGPGLICEPV